MTSSKASIAREIATQVLHRVDHEAAFASPTLDAALAAQPIDPRDAALATDIVYGTLRSLPRVDRAYEAHLSQEKDLDPYVRAALRAATYQLLHLERVPPHAVVDDAVTLVRAQRGERVGGFVNAVLRKVAKERPASPARPTRVEVPSWLETSLARSLGDERAQAFLGDRQLPPPIGLRVTMGVDRDELRARIAAAITSRKNASVEPTAISPHGLLLWGAGDPRALPGFEEGHFVVQEEGAQAIAEMLGARPGERVADACSGRGGKTLALLENVGPSGAVVAIDVHAPKLGRMRKELERVGLAERAVSFEAIDLSVGVAELEATFDRVLIDAPCTGLGTLHRRPEIVMRIDPGDPARLGELQRKILGNAARLAKPGGYVLYAVCSPLEEEGAAVIAGAEGLALDASETLVSADSDGGIRIGPWLAGAPDAYTVYRFRRVSS